ncbi:MAG: glycoside hydrolase [Gammaproteobacteria bacterium]|nr:glycoside hydrolase [Gammaproteobacteria bacterium]
MSDDVQRLKVVLCWHMHQPDYRGPDHSSYQLPWVYLHGIKDYVDMAAHLENNPGARAVVNFAPVLLEQLQDYVGQIQEWLLRGKQINDPILAALAGPGVPLDQESRRDLMRACLRANEKHMRGRFRTFRRLSDIVGLVDEHAESSEYLNDQFIVDLLVWYHLAWMGEHPRVNDLRIKSLEKKRKGYTAEDRYRLVESIGDLLASVVDRYRKLAEEGRVELSVTPYAHPILPLLLDIRSGQEAIPDMELPESASYPGGEERSRWHVRRGLESFENMFGFRPKGCWPAEGAVSEDTLRILEEEGFSWIASGQQVLHNSMEKSYADAAWPEQWAHRPYRVKDGDISCFFRNDGLSDLIGFTYADWHAEDAVSNLIHNLESIATNCDNPSDLVVSIIMDGENAWEHYPRNGCFFLDDLYARLSANPNLEMTTFSEVVEQRLPTYELNTMVAGSWVYGTFSTWIGEKDKNRAWDLLIEAKNTYDRVLASGRLSATKLAQAELQMATCEGSDWFWWFGDYNPGETVSDFERLFRNQLKHLYQILGEEPPEYLSQVFAYGGGDPAVGGVMRHN